MGLLVWVLASYIDNLSILSEVDSIFQMHFPCFITVNDSSDHHARLLQYLCRFCTFSTEWFR